MNYFTNSGTLIFSFSFFFPSFIFFFILAYLAKNFVESSRKKIIWVKHFLIDIWCNTDSMHSWFVSIKVHVTASTDIELAGTSEKAVGCNHLTSPSLCCVEDKLRGPLISSSCLNQPPRLSSCVLSLPPWRRLIPHRKIAAWSYVWPANRLPSVSSYFHFKIAHSCILKLKPPGPEPELS